jgi:hypothetical protein
VDVDVLRSSVGATAGWAVNQNVNVAANNNKASDAAPLGISSLQGWNHLLELSRWIQRVGLEFVVGVANKPDGSGNPSQSQEKAGMSGMLNDKMDDLFQCCVLQPCRDGALRDMQALIDHETWALQPIFIDLELDSLLLGNGNQEQSDNDSGSMLARMPDLDRLKDEGVFDFLATQGKPSDDDFVQNKSNSNDEQQVAVEDETADLCLVVAVPSGEDDNVINAVSDEEDKDISPTDGTMTEKVDLKKKNESGDGAGSESALPLAAPPPQEEELSEVRQLIGAFCTTTTTKNDDDTQPQRPMSVCCVGTNTIAEGLIQWTIRLLQIRRCLPFLSEDITAILKHMYDLCLTTIFRNVCGNSPLNERVLMYKDVSSSSFTAVTGSGVGGIGGVTPHHSGRSSPLTATGSRRSSSTLLMSNNLPSHHGHGHGRSASQSALMMVTSLTIEAELCYPPPNRVPRYVVLRKYLKQARERSSSGTTPAPSPLASATHSRKNSFVNVQQEQSLLALSPLVVVSSRDDLCRTFEQEFSATKSLLLTAVVLELATQSLVKDTNEEASTSVDATTSSSSHQASSHQDLVEYCAQIQQVVPLMMPLFFGPCHWRRICGARYCIRVSQ